MTQQMLADALSRFADENGYDFRITQPTISNWQRTPGIDVGHDMVIFVADFWGVTLDFLLGRVEGHNEVWKPKGTGKGNRRKGLATARNGASGTAPASRSRQSPRSTKP